MLRLRNKTFRVLRFLGENSQRLVTKEELLDAVWAGVSVTPELLRVYIRKVRRVLGDDPKTPRDIETVVGLGYRFLAEVAPSPVPTAKESRQISASLTPLHTLADNAWAKGQSPAIAARVPIRIGILHSLTGVMTWSESPVVDATLLGIEEINENGGILGRKIQPLVVDGQSQEHMFCLEAERLITQKKRARCSDVGPRHAEEQFCRFSSGTTIC